MLTICFPSLRNELDFNTILLRCEITISEHRNPVKLYGKKKTCPKILIAFFR